jgi:hypothetical protein
MITPDGGRELVKLKGSCAHQATHVCIRDAEALAQHGVDDLHRPFGQGPDTKFWLKRRAHLVHRENVKGGFKGSRHLDSDGHATASQPYDCRVLSGEVLHGGGKLPTCCLAIQEACGM